MSAFKYIMIRIPLLWIFLLAAEMAAYYTTEIIAGAVLCYG